MEQYIRSSVPKGKATEGRRTHRVIHVNETEPALGRGGSGRRKHWVLLRHPGFAEQRLADGREGQHLDAVDELHIGAEPRRI